jgi:hypothetical protein
MGSLAIEQDVRGDIVRQGFACVPQGAWVIGKGLKMSWERMGADWDQLEPDQYLEGSAKFRLRRYGRYYWAPGDDTLHALPHEPYFQPAEENMYAGGIKRTFGALRPETVKNPFLHALVRLTFGCLPIEPEKRDKTWEVRVHQIRIVATPKEPGLPAPEGIHQDGTDFLTLHLVRRENIVGGESTIYDLDRRPIAQYTMREALDSMILEDSRVMHGVTPVWSADGQSSGVRDLLGVDFIYSPDLQRPV